MSLELGSKLFLWYKTNWNGKHTCQNIIRYALSYRHICDLELKLLGHIRRKESLTNLTFTRCAEIKICKERQWVTANEFKLMDGKIGQGEILKQHTSRRDIKLKKKLSGFPVPISPTSWMDSAHIRKWSV